MRELQPPPTIRAHLDSESFVPLYAQLVEALCHAVEQNVYRPADRLPSERELAERYDVSRITANAALEELVKRGIAYRRRGRGTFVAKPRIRDISGFASFSDDMRERGLAPSSRLISLESVIPKADVRDRLTLAPGKPCFRLRRVRLADGDPMAIEDTHIPAHLCPGLENEDFEDGSLYEIFRTRYGLSPAWAEGIIEAAPADQEQAELLDLELAEPVLSIRRVTYDAKYVALEWVHSVYRADQFSFTTGRHRVESMPRSHPGRSA